MLEESEEDDGDDEALDGLCSASPLLAKYEKGKKREAFHPALCFVQLQPPVRFS
jgi:hypothetical protein